MNTSTEAEGIFHERECPSPIHWQTTRDSIIRRIQTTLDDRDRRILALEEAVRVLADCVNLAVGPMCRVGLVGVVDYVDRKLESNPIAREATEKERRGNEPQT